ncbi:hypothetical protein PUF88_04555 [Lactobacillaceae bacterium L1_55_11]|nr:hypothetical protein [Lactobacillaceae bacterium L1_55_11]
MDVKMLVASVVGALLGVYAFNMVVAFLSHAPVFSDFQSQTFFGLTAGIFLYFIFKKSNRHKD